MNSTIGLNMIKIETIEIAGFAGAFSALRLPFGKEARYEINKDLEWKREVFNGLKDVWEMSPSFFSSTDISIDRRDLDLMNTLVKRGTEHAKVTRGIMVWAKITAPRFWWQEFDTYRIGVEKLSSESTMHMIGMRDIKIDDFSVKRNSPAFDLTISEINHLAGQYREKKDRDLLYDIKALIPESFNQTRVAMMSYQALRNIARQRWNHRLPEWHVFVDWVKTLPFSRELILDGLDIKEKED